jgi:hypothetical protein
LKREKVDAEIWRLLYVQKRILVKNSCSKPRLRKRSNATNNQKISGLSDRVNIDQLSGSLPVDKALTASHRNNAPIGSSGKI